MTKLIHFKCRNAFIHRIVRQQCHSNIEQESLSKFDDLLAFIQYYKPQMYKNVTCIVIQ